MATPADILLRARVDDKVSKPLQQINTKINQTTKAGKDLGGQMRLMRGGAGQLGHQVQDVAVQLQMGTDAMIVFGQQGSQVAALFGPKGAMLGGLLAVGAALSGPVINALTGGSTALQKFRDDALEAAGSISELDGALREQAKAALRTELKEALTDQIRLTNQLEEAKAQLRVEEERTGGRSRAVQEDPTAELEDQIKKLEAQLQSATPQIAAMKDEYRGLNPELTALNKGLEDEIALLGLDEVQQARQTLATMAGTDAQKERYIALVQMLASKQANIEKTEKEAAAEEAAAKRTASAIDQINGKLLEEHIRLSGGQVALELYRASLLGLGEDSQAVALILANDAERTRLAEEKLEQQRQKAQAAEAKRKAENLARQKEQDKATALSMTKQFASMDTGSKKMFRIQKAFGIAAATISTFEAVNNALALKLPPPIPQVMAGIALTTGLANVAQIKAQSFEGGGFTGHGARAGGLDGKGGRMAMIHPNETVIDHSKGGASGVTVINNVDARGSGADVDQRIKSAMVQTSQQTIMTIQDLMRRGRFA